MSLWGARILFNALIDTLQDMTCLEHKLDAHAPIVKNPNLEIAAVSTIPVAWKGIVCSTYSNTEAQMPLHCQTKSSEPRTIASEVARGWLEREVQIPGFEICHHHF